MNQYCVKVFRVRNLNETLAISRLIFKVPSSVLQM